MKSFEQQVPHLASWVQDGWIEIGRTVYHMIAHLEESGFVSQVPRQVRSLRVLVPPQMLPALV